MSLIFLRLQGSKLRIEDFISLKLQQSRSSQMVNLISMYWQWSRFYYQASSL
ncbi:Pre-mRNA-splicing factor brr2 [Gossypium arboreum]|uniref:Pre-mRNA-splicing factor brr2 n=1 Tax=Gossypium arboreum TaxID=29729 RepID=A0A0B0N3Z8_GOSAR|nr:Pre-mRNA-splicing factor brr2 [Gossypium arboreum]